MGPLKRQKWPCKEHMMAGNTYTGMIYKNTDLQKKCRKADNDRKWKVNHET